MSRSEPHDTQSSGNPDANRREVSADHTLEPGHEDGESRKDVLTDEGEQIASGRRRMPKVLKLAALMVLAVGAVYLLKEGLREAPMLDPRLAGELDGYRLETGRPTPAAADALGDTFVPIEGVAREQVLQRLSEFRATWKVADPRIAVTSADVDGDANAFARQLEDWFGQHHLLAAREAQDSAELAGIPGATLPAPPLAGLLIRCRKRDEAIARDLVLALAPALGGAVNIVFDERVSASRMQLTIVGAPRFGESGIAYFEAA